MSLYLKGKGLFVFSDPGGAKVILSFIKLNSLKDSFIVSDREYSFYKEFELPVRIVKSGQTLAILEELKPDYVFTGTSYTSKIELDYVRLAKHKDITTYSFIDHYTRFNVRFQAENTTVFPDTIFLIDEKALEIAKSLGFEEHAQLVVTGNFYHNYLEQWTPFLSKEDVLSLLKLRKGERYFVCAPEPLSQVGGLPKWGIDEFQLLRKLSEVLDHLKDKNFRIVIRPHPNQKKGVLDFILNENSRFIMSPNELELNHLLYNSEGVIGMFSSILVEAAILKIPIIRYIEGLKVKDPLEDTLSFQVNTLYELERFLNT